MRDCNWWRSSSVPETSATPAVSSMERASASVATLLSVINRFSSMLIARGSTSPGGRDWEASIALMFTNMARRAASSSSIIATTLKAPFEKASCFSSASPALILSRRSLSL